MTTIPERLTRLLRDTVLAQDQGVPVFEQLQEAKFGLSLIDRLMVEADIERSRMKQEGIDVYTRDNEGGLIIGLDDKPYKPST